METTNIRSSWADNIGPSALKALRPAEGFGIPELTGNDNLVELFPAGALGVLASSGDTLIGLARTFSDTVGTTWLAELHVAPGWCGCGVDEMLLDQINNRFRGTALYCSPSVEKVDVYRARGIRPKVKLIACRRPPGIPAAEPGDVPDIVIFDDAGRYSAADFDSVIDPAFAISDSGTDDVTYLQMFGDGISGFFAETKAGRLVGVIRIFSDDRTKSDIAEICVHPDWQRRGIGRALLERAVARFSHTAIWAEAFPGTVPVLGLCGIAPDSHFVGCSRAPLV